MLLAKMMSEGKTVREIADTIGYSESTIYRARNIINCPQKQRDLWAARVISGGYTESQAAKALKVPVSWISAWVREMKEKGETSDKYRYDPFAPGARSPMDRNGDHR